MCNFCDIPVFIKTVQFGFPHTVEVVKAVSEIESEIYLPLVNKFCPMCGEPIKDEYRLLKGKKR